MTVTPNRTDRNAMDQTIDGHVQATRGAGVDSRLCSKGREWGGRMFWCENFWPILAAVTANVFFCFVFVAKFLSQLGDFLFFSQKIMKDNIFF